MFEEVIIIPRKHFTEISITVRSNVRTNIIVLIYNDDQKILQIFSWDLIKGQNMTNTLVDHSWHEGIYWINFFDQEGRSVYKTSLRK